jgi:hypothetical protein
MRASILAIIVSTGFLLFGGAMQAMEISSSTRWRTTIRTNMSLILSWAP